MNPILAAKILGPALTISGWILKIRTIVLLMALKKLYEEFKKPRTKKSIDRITMSHLCGVKKNNSIITTAKAALIWTALSLTCLNAMGHIIFITGYCPIHNEPHADSLSDPSAVCSGSLKLHIFP